MNRVEKLIAELCPKGVEYKELGEVFFISRGRVISKDYLRENSGEYPVYSSQTANNGEIGKIDTYDYSGEYLTWTTDGAHAGTVFYRDEQFSITNVCGLLKVKNKSLSIKFAFYVLSVIMKSYVTSGMGNPKLMSNVVSKIQIPIPPLAIQEEIVRILDKFTQLEAELEAELEARKLQYEYYRNQLLTPIEKEGKWWLNGVEVEWKEIQDVFEMKNGYTPSKSKKEYWTDGTIPWFRMEDIRQNGRILSSSIQYITPEAIKGSGLFPANSIIVSTSATIGEHALITVDFLANQRFTCLTKKKKYFEKLSMKYFQYYMFIVDEWCKNNINISGFAGVDMPKFKKYKIPLPPLAEQNRIVEILDKFDALTNDISQGLPAEIEARRQQYEYYREKLLNFENVIS